MVPRTPQHSNTFCLCLQCVMWFPTTCYPSKRYMLWLNILRAMVEAGKAPINLRSHRYLHIQALSKMPRLPSITLERAINKKNVNFIQEKDSLSHFNNFDQRQQQSASSTACFTSATNSSKGSLEGRTRIDPLSTRICILPDPGRWSRGD
jgi:hypothetical protein